MKITRQYPITVLAVGLVALLMQGCTRHQSVPAESFASPEAAVHALTAALRADDLEQLRTIVGSDGEEIIASGDEAADRHARQEFLRLYDEKHSIVAAGDGSATLVIGKAEWPYPVPLVKDGNEWFFDAAAGAEEILNRRIGRNELSAIQVCKAIGDAQQEYALRDPDGDGIREYAKQFPSDPGQRNGLYWPAAEGEEASPLGNFAAQAAAEGYVRRETGPTPYHGYYYRILQAQGPHAPGGAVEYVINGRMILGFAVVAYPAEYDNSGIMTFIMGSDGVVYQRDLGEDTAEKAAAMKTFDPGEGWTKVE